MSNWSYPPRWRIFACPIALSGDLVRNGRNRGFTLVELAVTVAIVAILVTLAAPSYHRFIIDARMTGASNEFLTNLYFTRSEAVKRDTTVTMCKSNNPDAALPACTTSGTWAQGWVVFVDAAGTGVVPDVTAILRVHSPLTDGSTLVGSAGVANLVTYQPSGQSPQSGQFNLCSSDTALPGRDITIAVTGSVRSATDIAAPCS